MIYMIGNPNRKCRELIRRTHDFGSMITPGMLSRWSGVWALDNGCWANRNNPSWWETTGERDWCASIEAARELSVKPLWCVVPDIVGDGTATLKMYTRYSPVVTCNGLQCALALQDGMTANDVDQIGNVFCLFLGGSTEWKLATMPYWARYAQATGRWFHVARVNTKRRYEMALYHGADSCDGSGFNCWHDTLSRTILPAHRQMRLRY